MKPHIKRIFVLDTVVGYFSCYAWGCNGRSGVTPKEAYARWKLLGDYRL